MLSLSKRPGKWSFRWFSRTLRHEIGPTAYSGCQSVQGNGHSAGFHGRYDTKSALQHVRMSKRPEEWPFRWFFRTLRHEIGLTAYSGCPSVQGNGSCASICGRYDTKSALQRILAAQVSGEINLPLVFPDTTTRNRPYSVFWLPKRLGKWGFRWFYGHYDTISGLQRILADQTSVEMNLPLVFTDVTTRNRAYSMFSLSKRPGKWHFRWFSRTLRHEIGPTACSGCPSVWGNGLSAKKKASHLQKKSLQLRKIKRFHLSLKLNNKKTTFNPRQQQLQTTYNNSYKQPITTATNNL